MRFDCKADSKAQDAGDGKSVTEEAARGDDAETYGYTRGVAGYHQQFAIGQ